jgi:hypothetical protein
VALGVILALDWNCVLVPTDDPSDFLLPRVEKLPQIQDVEVELQLGVVLHLVAVPVPRISFEELEHGRVASQSQLYFDAVYS